MLLLSNIVFRTLYSREVSHFRCSQCHVNDDTLGAFAPEKSFHSS